MQPTTVQQAFLDAKKSVIASLAWITTSRIYNAVAAPDDHLSYTFGPRKSMDVRIHDFYFSTEDELKEFESETSQMLEYVKANVVNTLKDAINNADKAVARSRSDIKKEAKQRHSGRVHNS